MTDEDKYVNVVTINGLPNIIEPTGPIIPLASNTASATFDDIAYCRLEKGHDGDHEPEEYIMHKCDGEGCCNQFKENRCPYVKSPHIVYIWTDYSWGTHKNE